MKKTLPLIFLYIISFGCADIFINDIEVDYSTSTVIPGQSELGIPSIPGQEPPVISLTDIGFNEFTQFDINASETFQDRVGSVTKVTFINLETFKLSSSDNQQSLDFLDSVKFYISIGDQADSLLAFSDNFPIGITEVYLEVSKELDLTPYINSDDITIRAEFLGVVPNDEIEIQADLVFLVDTVHSADF